MAMRVGVVLLCKNSNFGFYLAFIWLLVGF
jgi:hypothetical protein